MSPVVTLTQEIPCPATIAMTPPRLWPQLTSPQRRQLALQLANLLRREVSVSAQEAGAPGAGEEVRDERPHDAR
jgi:hypothetical protein